MKIFKDERGFIITEKQLKEDYITSNTKSDGGTFENYIENCLQKNGGTLKEIKGVMQNEK